MSARSLNRVMLIGNLTRDPELRYTPSGTAVCTIGLATNRSWVPTDGGERHEETEYHRVVAWAKLAEICSQLLYKGRKVYVEGRLQTRKWTTQDGIERETTEIVIDSMIALGAPKGGGNRGYRGYQDDRGYQNTSYAASTPAPVQDDLDDGEEDGEDIVDDVMEEVVVEDEKPDKKKPGKKNTASRKKEEKVDVDDIPF